MILADFNGIAVSETMALLAQDSNASEREIVTIILNRMASLAQQHKKKYGEMVLCFEGKGNWRKKLYPNFKKNRKTEKKKGDFDWDMIHGCFSECKDIVDNQLQWMTVAPDNTEADDSIAVLVKALAGPTLIVSRDSDFFGLHTAKVKQFDHVSKKLVGVKGDLIVYMHEKYKRGSAKENIANVKMPIDFITECVGRQSPITAKWLLADEMTEKEHERFEENRNLMDFNRIPTEVSDSILDAYRTQLRKAPVPIMKMTMSLSEAGYKALARNAKQFVK